MDNFVPERPPKKKYSAAIIAVIICAAIVAGAVAIAILNPEGGFDILPPFAGESGWGDWGLFPSFPLILCR